MGTTTLGDSGARNLTQLARQEGVSLASLLRANPQLSNPNVVGGSQRIKIPSKYESESQSESSQARQLARVYSAPLASGATAAIDRPGGTEYAAAAAAPTYVPAAVNVGQTGRNWVMGPLAERHVPGTRGAATDVVERGGTRRAIGAGPVGPAVPAVAQNVSSREAWEQSLAGTFEAVSGRAGAGTVGPAPVWTPGVSGRAGVGLVAGPALPSTAGITGVAGVGEISRPAPLEGYSYGRAGVGLVTPPFGGGRLPTAPAGVSGRAGVGLVTGPAAPRMTAVSMAAESATTAAAPTATFRTPTPEMAQGAIARQESRALANAARAYAGNLSYAARTGDLRARPAVLSGELANSTAIRQLWEGQYASADEFLAALGYRQLPGTDQWIRYDPMTTTGGGGYGGYSGGGGGGGGGGGYASTATGSRAGGGGTSYGSNMYLNWRIRYTA